MRHNKLRSLAMEIDSVGLAKSGHDKVPTDEPDLVQCPISNDVMEDPVLAADGCLYDNTYIQQWFATGHTTSPMSNQPMARTVQQDRHMQVLCAAWL